MVSHRLCCFETLNGIKNIFIFSNSLFNEVPILSPCPCPFLHIPLFLILVKCVDHAPPFISTPVARHKLTSQYKHIITAHLEPVAPVQLQTSNERCKSTHWDPKSNIPWAHVSLFSVHPFRPKHPQNGGRRDVELLLLYGDDLFRRGRVCVCQALTATVSHSSVLSSSAHPFIQRGWEGGERAASEHTVLCNTLSVRSMHSSRSHHGTMNILFSQPRAYKHTHTHAHCHMEDTFTFGGHTNP